MDQQIFVPFDVAAVIVTVCTVIGAVVSGVAAHVPAWVNELALPTVLAQSPPEVAAFGPIPAPASTAPPAVDRLVHDVVSLFEMNVELEAAMDVRLAQLEARLGRLEAPQAWQESTR